MTKSVSELKSSLDHRIIIAIVGLSVLVYLHDYVIFTNIWIIDETGFSYYLSSAAASIMAFLVARRYSGSEVFGKAYLALGLAYSMLFIGMAIWDYHEIVLQVEPYPSMSDIFNFSFYPLIIYHLLKNTRYFTKSLKFGTKIWLAVLPISITLIYAYLSFPGSGELTFDYYYGFPFVIGASVSLSFAILGAKIFRQSMLGNAWLLLAIGISINTFADVAYFYQQALNLYIQTGPSPIYALWVGSHMIIFYSLYKHKKVI